jgi:hypothetical protein
MQPRADYRCDPVGADERVARNRATVLEVECGVVAAHLESYRFARERQLLGTHGVEQRAMENGAQRDHRGRARWGPVGGDINAAQHVSTRPANFRAARDVPRRNNALGHAQLSQGSRRVGRKVEREPKLARIDGTFENPHRPSRAAQGETSSEAANAGADDEGSPGIRQLAKQFCRTRTRASGRDRDQAARRRANTSRTCAFVSS